MTENRKKERVTSETMENHLEEKIDKYGEEIGKKIEEKVEQNIPKYAEPIAGVIFMSIFLVFVNLFWDRFDFITEEFADLLPIYNVILLVSILTNAIRIFIHSKAFKVIGDMVNTLLMAYFAYLLWMVFPFDVEEIWELLIKGLILVPTLLSLLGLFVEIVKLFADQEE